jgi:DNA sulfur modification protein DndD
MKLKSLVLQNFMGYKGEHKINFETTDHAKVILFLGENGHGKSTIHHAARWCLYGETKKGQRTIDESILFNRPAKENAKLDLSTSMSVTMEWEDEGHEYSLTRDCSYATSDQLKTEEYLRIDKSNSVPQSSIRHYVQMFFAKEISHFFFFDGEWQREFDQMAENDEEAVYIKSEIEKTLSIPTISTAIQWLEEKRGEEWRSIRSLEKKKETADELENKLEDLEKKISLDKEEIDGIIKQLKDDNARLNILQDMVGNFATVQSEHDRMVELRGQIKNNNSRKQQFFLDIKEQMNSNVRWSPVAKTLTNKLEDIMLTRKNIESMTLKTESLKKKVDNLIQLRDLKVCPVCESIPDKESNFYSLKIEEAQKEIASIDLSDAEVSENHLKYITDLGFNQTKISNLKNIIKEYNEYSATSVALGQDLKDIEINLSFSPDIDVKKIMTEANSISSNITRREQSLEFHKKRLSDYEKEASSIQTKLSKSADVSPQKRYSYNSFAYLKGLFEKSKDQYVAGIRKEVERYASETFNKIISDKKFEGLQINENFGVGLRMKDGTIETLRSTGQGKVSAISLISGLLQTSMKDGFILMDTPFVSLDMGHREQVCKWAAESNMNVSLFLHSGEFIKERDLGMLENKVGRVYRIMKINDDESTIQLEN